MGAEKQTILFADDDQHARSYLRFALRHQLPSTARLTQLRLADS